MASRYSIKSAFSRWTRAKAKVRVAAALRLSAEGEAVPRAPRASDQVWKLNLQQVQNWLNGKGEAPQDAERVAKSKWHALTSCLRQLDQKLQVRPAAPKRQIGSCLLPIRSFDAF